MITIAEKRMFSKTIIDSDAFLEMPVTSQLLYFHLSMRADDDGFVNKPKAIMRIIGAKDDDIKVLFAKKFVIPFDSGIVVIKHWRINNYIRNDTYHETTYKAEKALLSLDENNAYSLSVTSPLQISNEDATQISIDKNRLDKNSIDEDIVPSETLDTTKPILYKLPLLDKYHKKHHPIYQEDIDHYKELYPSVDVEQEIRTMIGWLESNPTRQKTPSGIKNFITKWLSKEQNKGKVENGRTKPSNEQSSEPFDYSSIKWYNRPID